MTPPDPSAASVERAKDIERSCSSARHLLSRRGAICGDCAALALDAARQAAKDSARLWATLDTIEEMTRITYGGAHLIQKVRALAIVSLAARPAPP